MNPQEESINLPRWVYVTLATVTAGIGLAASGVTAQFFVLGLQRLEPDPMARSILVATGLLMIAAELAAFGVAALLPANTLRSMRRKLIATGLLLLAFEGATIAITQGALDQASEAAASASAHRVQELQASIQARRAAAQSLRENGMKQSASTNAWTRTLGANALRDALKVEGEIEPLATELARLQAAARPTTVSVLGEHATMAYGLARGILISTMGLVMFGAAGALLRQAMGRPQVQVQAQARVQAQPAAAAEALAPQAEVAAEAQTRPVAGAGEAAAPGDARMRRALHASLRGRVRRQVPPRVEQEVTVPAGPAPQARAADGAKAHVRRGGWRNAFGIPSRLREHAAGMSAGRTDPGRALSA